MFTLVCLIASSYSKKRKQPNNEYLEQNFRQVAYDLRRGQIDCSQHHKDELATRTDVNQPMLELENSGGPVV